MAFFAKISFRDEWNTTLPMPSTFQGRVMQSESFQNLIDFIPLLTCEQLDILNTALLNAQIGVSEAEDLPDTAPSDRESLPQAQHAAPDLETSILIQFAEHPYYPECKGQNIGRWGFQNGRQHYHCKTCNITFNAFSRTPLARLRHSEKWIDYLTGMTPSMTLRSAASQYNIDLKTSFRWRHRFLEVINNDQAKELCEITEPDETFFRESLNREKSS